MIRKSIEQLIEDNRDKIVVDIRSKEEYEKETYPGAVNIFWEQFDNHINEIPKEKPVYLICYTGQKSDEIAERLSEEGYEIYSIENGYHSYLRLKLKQLMEQGEEEQSVTCKDVERSIVKKFRKSHYFCKSGAKSAKKRSKRPPGSPITV